MIGALTNHLWQSTLFAVIAGLLTIVFRKNRAQVRYWLWFGASFKFFVPFSLLMSLGGYLAMTPPARKIAIHIAAPAFSPAMGQISQPFPGIVSLMPSKEPQCTGFVFSHLEIVVLCVLRKACSKIAFGYTNPHESGTL